MIQVKLLIYYFQYIDDLKSPLIQYAKLYYENDEMRQKIMYSCYPSLNVIIIASSTSVFMLIVTMLQMVPHTIDTVNQVRKWVSNVHK